MATDSDIKIAYATPIPPTAWVAPMDDSLPLASATTTTTTATTTSSRPDLLTSSVGGRSSRFMLPTDDQEHAEITEQKIRSLLEQGYTRGLAEALRINKLAFPLSMWIVDNSGSMQHNDGHRILSAAAGKEIKFVPCSRWAEMQQTVEYHAQLAALLRSPTVFRLLNDPGRAVGQQQFSIAEKTSSSIDQDLAIAQQTMSNACPGGCTPLIPHIHEVRNNLLALEPELRRNGTKVVLVLATDGLPTNERGIADDLVKSQFVEAMRSLEGLPLWIVVRLCTDEREVVEFWNSLDEQLELSLEVLDDFVSEAEEVYNHNKWLNYGLPLHRMRELGFYHRLFDLLDERTLTKTELRDFFRVLFGDGALDGVPDPEADWKTFYNKISRVVQGENKTWNPITKRMEPWIDLQRLKKDYGSGGWFSFFDSCS